MAGTGFCGTAVDPVRDGRAMRLCPECLCTTGHHPNCPEAEDDPRPGWLINFCEKFDAEEVEIFTHVYTAKVNRKRAEKGLPPVQQVPLMRTDDYRKAILKAFTEEE